MMMVGELFDSCPSAKISPPLFHSYVGIHNPTTATNICGKVIKRPLAKINFSKVKGTAA